MAILTRFPDEEDEPLTAINTTPLVDVMLVLLIIFLVTIPAVTAAIKVKLPDETHRPHVITPDSVVLTVNQIGTVFINEIKVETNADLHQKLKEISTVDPQPTLQILGDAETAFQYIGMVLDVVKSVGFKTVHFVTEPEAVEGT